MFSFLSALSTLSTLKGLKEVLQKYWLYLVAIVTAIALVLWFYNWSYNHGATVTTKFYQAKEIKDEKAKNEQYDKLFGKYTKLLVEKKATEDKLQQSVANAEKQSKAYQTKLTSFQQQLAKVKTYVPTKTADTPPFTFGFVGLYNLSIKGPLSTEQPGHEIGLPDVLSAAGVVDGSPTFDLSRSSGVTVDSLLTVHGYNSGITNQCLKDRALMKTFIDDVCGKGLCK